MWGRFGAIGSCIGRSLACACVLAACAFEHGVVPGGDGGNPPPGDARRDAPIDAHNTQPTTDAPPDAAAPPPPPPSCPGAYNLHDSARPNSHYRSVSASTTWTSAEAICEGDDVNSHLIVLDDDAERVWAFQQNNSDQWVGITDIDSEGTWIPVTDQAAWFTGAAAGNLPAKDCLYLNASNTVAEACSGGHPYLCECDGQAADNQNF
jgi:hypothetical protein